ncbi:MAG TPA: UDP-N-acetylmuramoyl-L-alanyl-D-glutamate--2,6-diaminopimelate ligase [Candidatus Aquilonibacter sp.]|jgi:UDP-N-acetylmuramoyl-L-alanyl-D-glutamate--2,6-diaminopimelate ligase|nr:UDP-N-acetylmuramoyl-L-alanyl-D-glutamate--2,6-diaminopimelate ligase [Candidatus Aquilonibacter sp.]
MTFQQLLDGAEILAQTGDAAVNGVEYDSRRVKPGTVFVAMRGESSDGNRFIDQAIHAGAVAIVTDAEAEKPRPGVAWAVAVHGRRALARVSANFYKKPAKRLAITGITGTNGKSTTAFLVESILTAAGRKSALIGTIEYHVAGKILSAPHTTPEALELNQIFNEALGHGATDAVMEVSSHALAQERVYGVPFDVAVFTNLTHDHLDYHNTMEEYFAAKRILFEGCGTEAPRAVVMNIDNEYGAKLAEFSRKHSSVVLKYGWQQGDLHAEKVEITTRGTRFDLMTPGGKIAVFSALIGRVNVYNILAAAGACYARGCSIDAIAAGIGKLASVPGRFERADCGQPFTVVVDYAHTDDALRNLTALARELVSGKGRVLTVFGCGGDRDRNKRPLMGEAAGRGSDFVVLTSDNPRSEDPLAIMNDAVVGLQKTGVKYSIEADRRKAIALAIGEAGQGDIVLLAGKGHEKLQITRQGAAPFDDLEVAREALRAMGFECNVAGAGAMA